ncbi:MAG: cell division protein ZapA [Deltaproteobacteria bacterium]|jgi:cell division protein ZapA (FtsZ GTPase activity inhibitor)|nr:cell division protein ZapA [Deltaproteobacteria bacterium]
MDPFKSDNPASSSDADGRSSPGQTSIGGEKVPPSVALEVVTVKIFGRQYRFKSNSPNFVNQIAETIGHEIEQVNKQHPALPHEMDLAAHVAFRLAWAKTKNQEKIEQLNDSLTKAENYVKRLTAIIDLNTEK